MGAVRRVAFCSGATPTRVSRRSTLANQIVENTLISLGSQQGRNARNWQQSVIPKKGLAFGDARTVPSFGCLFDTGREHHLTVRFLNTLGGDRSQNKFRLAMQ